MSITETASSSVLGKRKRNRPNASLGKRLKRQFVIAVTGNSQVRASFGEFRGIGPPPPPTPIIDAADNDGREERKGQEREGDTYIDTTPSMEALWGFVGGDWQLWEPAGAPVISTTDLPTPSTTASASSERTNWIEHPRYPGRFLWCNPGQNAIGWLGEASIIKGGGSGAYLPSPLDDVDDVAPAVTATSTQASTIIASSAYKGKEKAKSTDDGEEEDNDPDGNEKPTVRMTSQQAIQLVMQKRKVLCERWGGSARASASQKAAGRKKTKRRRRKTDDDDSPDEDDEMEEDEEEEENDGQEDHELDEDNKRQRQAPARPPQRPRESVSLQRSQIQAQDVPPPIAPPKLYPTLRCPFCPTSFLGHTAGAAEDMWSEHIKVKHGIIMPDLGVAAALIPGLNPPQELSKEIEVVCECRQDMPVIADPRIKLEVEPQLENPAPKRSASCSPPLNADNDGIEDLDIDLEVTLVPALFHPGYYSIAPDTPSGSRQGSRSRSSSRSRSGTPELSSDLRYRPPEKYHETERYHETYRDDRGALGSPLLPQEVLERLYRESNARMLVQQKNGRRNVVKVHPMSASTSVSMSGTERDTSRWKGRDERYEEREREKEQREKERPTLAKRPRPPPRQVSLDPSGSGSPYPEEGSASAPVHRTNNKVNDEAAMAPTPRTFRTSNAGVNIHYLEYHGYGEPAEDAGECGDVWVDLENAELWGKVYVWGPPPVDIEPQPQQQEGSEQQPERPILIKWLKWPGPHTMLNNDAIPIVAGGTHKVVQSTNEDGSVCNDIVFHPEASAQDLQMCLCVTTRGRVGWNAKASMFAGGWGTGFDRHQLLAKGLKQRLDRRKTSSASMSYLALPLSSSNRGRGGHRVRGGWRGGAQGSKARDREREERVGVRWREATSERGLGVDDDASVSHLPAQSESYGNETEPMDDA